MASQRESENTTRGSGRRRAAAAAVVSVLGLAGAGLAWAGGCGTVNPFAVLFATGLSGVQPGTTGGGPGPGTTGSGDFQTLCELPDNQRSMTIEVRNESRAEVDFALLLITTVGQGGFVCENERDRYIQFGYEVEFLNANLAHTYGCETVVLDSGEDLLVARIEGTIPARPMDETFVSAGPPFDGSAEIPLPTVILLGDDKNPSMFDCTNNDPCTQGGFLYRAGNFVLAPASRTQGTLCNTRVTARPRWVLRNPRLLDRLARNFEYTKGGQVVITILDRASNTDSNTNQVVWFVRGTDGRIIHEELR